MHIVELFIPLYCPVLRT